MSYILDALKKADAARERESVPGLHSRHDAPLPDADDDSEDLAGGGPNRASNAPQGLVRGMVAGAALVTVTALVAWWWRPDAPLNATAPGVAPLPAPAAPAAPPAPATLSMSPSTPPSPPLAPAAQVAVVPPPQPVAAERKRVADAPLRVDPSLKDPPPRVVSYQELPDDIKRELPTLNVGGAMHSEVAANRMLILNGGLFREGEQPAPGLVLEEIKLKSAVFSYKGHRYSVAY